MPAVQSEVNSTGKKCPIERHEKISIGEAHLEADLCIPEAAKALILFVHGSGSGADRDGSGVSYTWSKTSGPSGGNIATPSATSTQV